MAKTKFSRLLKAIQEVRSHLETFFTPSSSADYRKWRQRFLLERLHLTIWIAFIIHPTFAIMGVFVASTLNAIGDATQAVSQDQIWLALIQAAATQLCLLLCLMLLRTPQGHRCPEALFLFFSWSLTVLSQFQATLRGEAQLVGVAWFLVFPIQATLLPVRWHFHVVSQVGALGYYFGANLFGLKDPKIVEPVWLVNVLVAFTFFWLCFICDLGVYLYERLQKSEFESSQQLRVFLHAVSHDLRNPVLGTMMVLKNLLNQTGEKVQVSRSLIQRILEGSDRQLNLINSLLEAHDTEIRGITLHCQPLQLYPLVQSAIADLQPLLTKEDATIIHEIDPNLPLINADPLQLGRVYQNLIVNAIKHNPPNLTIILGAQQEGEMLRCIVKDNGVGMSPQQCAKLFDLYFRGSQKPLGLGLGLYLCRQIITAHGGEINVYSRLGEETTFSFTLPLV